MHTQTHTLKGVFRVTCRVDLAEIIMNSPTLSLLVLDISRFCIEARVALLVWRFSTKEHALGLLWYVWFDAGASLLPKVIFCEVALIELFDMLSVQLIHAEVIENLPSSAQIDLYSAKDVLYEMCE